VATRGCWWCQFLSCGCVSKGSSVWSSGPSMTAKPVNRFDSIRMDDGQLSGKQCGYGRTRFMYARSTARRHQAPISPLSSSEAEDDNGERRADGGECAARISAGSAAIASTCGLPTEFLPKWGQPRAQTPVNRACFAKSLLFYPHLPSPCQTRTAPAAGWIANVSMQVGGNASRSGAQTSA
jgi:hypothetical protein